MLRAVVFALSLCFGGVGHAADTPASEATIKEMLVVTEVQKLLEGMLPQIEAMMKQSMQQATARLPLSDDDREMMNKMSSSMMESLREEMSWSKLEPMYVRIYRKTFTQEELEGILTFYRTPIGIAMIKKMPAVMQESMQASQQMLQPMMERMQGTVQEMVRELEAKKKQRAEQAK